MSRLLDQNTNIEGHVSNEDIIAKTVGTTYAGNKRFFSYFTSLLMIIAAGSDTVGASYR